MKILLLFTVFANYTFATDFLFYCDEAFSNKNLYQAILDEKNNFNIEESQIKLTYNVNNDEASMSLSGESISLTSASYDEETKTLEVLRLKGSGIGGRSIGFGYTFNSPKGCDDKKATMESFNIGGIAGGLSTGKMNCVCSID